MTLSRTAFYGDGEHVSFNADTQLSFGLGRMKRLTPLSAALAVKLPNALLMPGLGGPYFWLLNDGSFAIDVEDFVGGLVQSLPAGHSTVVLLSNQGTAAGQWHIDPHLPISGSSSAGFDPSASPMSGSNQWSGGLSQSPA